MKPMVEIRNLKKYYGKGENLVKAVDHTNLTIERGKFTAIVGRSGSGKSTMLHLMGGLDRPDKGRVFIDGEDIFKLKDEQLAVFRRKKIGFIFQDYNLLPSLNVWENIVLPLGLDNKKVDHNYVYYKSTHNRRERPVYGHRGGSRGRFYYRITTFEERPWDARDPHKTTFMALKHAIRLSI